MGMGSLGTVNPFYPEGALPAPGGACLHEGARLAPPEGLSSPCLLPRSDVDDHGGQLLLPVPLLVPSEADDPAAVLHVLERRGRVPVREGGRVVVADGPGHAAVAPLAEREG